MLGAASFVVALRTLGFVTMSVALRLRRMLGAASFVVALRTLGFVTMSVALRLRRVLGAFMPTYHRVCCGFRNRGLRGCEVPSEGKREQENVVFHFFSKFNSLVVNSRFAHKSTLLF